MKHRTLIFSLAAIFAFLPSLSFADTFTASVQNISPGNSVMAKNKLTFNITTSGFVAQSFQITDSFGVSSVANTNFDGGGNFQWVPLVSDVGTHNFTITARDYSGDSATTQLSVTVLPLPTISIASVSSSAITAGQKLTFTVSQSGLSNPTYVVGDSFSGSSVTSQNLSGGNFTWTPDYAQNGKHTITVYATDSQGHSAQTSVDVQVGAGPTLMAMPVHPGTTINAGTTVSFTVGAINFIPTGFSISDSFSGGTVSNANINTSGNFVWTPSGSDIGTHTLLIKGQVGAFGDSATTSQTLYVVAAGASTSSPPVSTTVTTGSASSTLLSSLQAQLAALTAKMSQVSTPPVTSNAYTFTSYLKPGMRSDEVLQLQKLLADLGLLSAAPNGYYGVGTTAAVKAFQKAHDLEQLGVVGPSTRAALNALGTASVSTSTTAPTTVSSGTFKFEHFMGYGDDDTADVTQLQMFLQSLGYLSANSPLGFYGSATEQAVKKFQSSKGLPSTGYVDSQTRNALNQ